MPKEAVVLVARSALDKQANRFVEEGDDTVYFYRRAPLSRNTPTRLLVTLAIGIALTLCIYTLSYLNGLPLWVPAAIWVVLMVAVYGDWKFASTRNERAFMNRMALGDRLIHKEGRVLELPAILLDKWHSCFKSIGANISHQELLQQFRLMYRDPQAAKVVRELAELYANAPDEDSRRKVSDRMGSDLLIIFQRQIRTRQYDTRPGSR